MPVFLLKRGGYRVFVAFYYVFCTLMCAVYGVQRDAYHFLISLGTLLVPPGLWLVYRIFHLNRSPRLDMLILGYAFLAYPLGACVDFYRRVPGFDKLAHGLSGVLVALLCIVLFVLLKPGRQLQAEDLPLAMVFVFFGSMAVAGLWEIGEYVLSGIVRIDLQRVMATGVADSMRDMIVCMLGTLAALPVLPRLVAGKDGMVVGAVREFLDLNVVD